MRSSNPYPSARCENDDGGDRHLVPPTASLGDVESSSPSPPVNHHQMQGSRFISRESIQRVQLTEEQTPVHAADQASTSRNRSNRTTEESIPKENQRHASAPGNEETSFDLKYTEQTVKEKGLLESSCVEGGNETTAAPNQGVDPLKCNDKRSKTEKQADVLSQQKQKLSKTLPQTSTRESTRCPHVPYDQSPGDVMPDSLERQNSSRPSERSGSNLEFLASGRLFQEHAPAPHPGAYHMGVESDNELHDDDISSSTKSENDRLEQGLIVPVEAEVAGSSQERQQEIKMLRVRRQRYNESNQPIVQGEIVLKGIYDDDEGTRCSRRQIVVGIFCLVILVTVVVVGVVVGMGNRKSGSNSLPPLPIDNKTLFPTDNTTCLANDDLKTAVDEYLSDNGPDTDVAKKYGWPIGIWCVSNVWDFSELFSANRNPDAANFNENLEGWDTSEGGSMEAMFYGARAFNQDISMWDVSKVEAMLSMFMDASSFNQNLSSWEVSKVTNMNGMFSGASLFNGNISEWDVSSVTTMVSLLNAAKSFNQNISSWDVSRVLDFSDTFSSAAAFNQHLDSWDVSSAREMDGMFHLALAFNQDISSWNVSGVTTFLNMFHSAASYNSAMSLWDVSNARSMQSMFQDALAFNQNIASWDVRGSTVFTDMFKGATNFNQNLCAWGPSIQNSGAAVDGMFEGTACSATIDANLSSSPPGPFCRECN